jgi:hypothetical protein
MGDTRAKSSERQRGERNTRGKVKTSGEADSRNGPKPEQGGYEMYVWGALIKAPDKKSDPFVCMVAENGLKLADNVAIREIVSIFVRGFSIGSPGVASSLQTLGVRQ